MDYVFASHSGDKFVLFGKIHLITLGILLVFNLISIVPLIKIHSPKTNHIFKIGMALFMSVLFVAGAVFTIVTGEWSLKNSLPLHLCDTVVIISIITLLAENKYLYEPIYFWGLSGTLQALITPAIKYNFPHFMYFYFFMLHGSVITAILFMTLVKKYRPTKASLLRAFVVLNLYAGFVFGLNLLLKSNYMYLSRKPPETTLLNYLGPWPVYLLTLEGIAVISFLFYYVPFWIIDLKKRKIKK